MITKKFEDGRVECKCACGVVFVTTQAAVDAGTVKHCGCQDKPGVAPKLELSKPSKKK